MKLNFCLPHETIYKDKGVDQVIVTQQKNMNCTNGSAAVDLPLDRVVSSSYSSIKVSATGTCSLVLQ